MAVALLSVPATAINVDDDPLTSGIFLTETTAFRFPAVQDTNIDSVSVGDDKAIAFGNPWNPNHRAYATNELEITKTQDSGECVQCTDADGSTCADSCIKVNLEQISVGNRESLAFGFGTSNNKVKITATQD
jgi:hypothetical protein